MAKTVKIVKASIGEYTDKDGKVKQSCKEVKQHKKLEGTEIPKK